MGKEGQAGKQTTLHGVSKKWARKLEAKQARDKRRQEKSMRKSR